MNHENDMKCPKQTKSKIRKNSISMCDLDAYGCVSLFVDKAQTKQIANLEICQNCVIFFRYRPTKKKAMNIF